ncbi:MAG: hypothetical protein WAN66_21135 [Limnoraphis robusta]|uniref:Type I restriction enzyme R protein N-terminal domain-containing protein n=1 Tax=Limnoraphis robusta CS-951 TaxID=1637645 RepID=A0A0F5YDR9_9CYAN|nr:hypothetical protein [Limnoraphis robusta]KKD36390.1 hypothetical protein WN50_20010 [Limnoraphis robusta CS-951]
MTKPPLLKPDQIYTFSKYFELTFDPEDILEELGYSLVRSQFNFSQFSGQFEITSLKNRIEQDLIVVDLTSETARREVIIAPVLLELCRFLRAKLKIEYPIVVNDRLRGSVDYLVQFKNSFLVVEAKNADLSRGFTQLSVELIALDQWINSPSEMLWGAVTTGDIWKFGVLSRPEKQIRQDINLYRVPADLEELMRILIGLLISE